MKFRSIIYLLMLFILFTACKKSENENVHFPQTLYFTSLVTKTPMRMFTSAGQIIDTVKINHFIAADKVYMNPNEAFLDTASLIFKSADTLVFVGDRFPLSVKKNNDQFLLYTTKQLVQSNLPDIYLNLFLYPFLFTPIDNSSGYAGLLQYVDVASGDYSNFSLSVLSYKVYQVTSPTSYTVISGTAFNEFNNSFLKTLGPTDTIAVQEFSEVYTAR